MAQEGTYWYLGIEQVFKPDHSSVSERHTEVYAEWLRCIWCYALSAKHKGACHKHLGRTHVPVLLHPGQVVTPFAGAARQTDS